MYLADVSLQHQNVPRCQVSVDKPFAREVLHTQGHLLRESQKDTWCVFMYILVTAQAVQKKHLH